jgi:hypothetical protein
MMTLLISAGPIVGMLLAAVLATRALVVASGPSLRVGTRGLTLASVALAILYALAIALRFITI